MVISYEDSRVPWVIPLNNEFLKILPGLTILESFIFGQPGPGRERVTAQGFDICKVRARIPDCSAPAKCLCGKKCLPESGGGSRLAEG